MREPKDLDQDAARKVFSPLLDPDQVKALFQERLPGFSKGLLQIKRCAVGHTWYKRYQNPRSQGKTTLSLCYHLEVEDLREKKSGTQVLYAKACLEGRSRSIFENLETSSYVTPEYGPPCLHLPEVDMVVWAFPNDPVLAHLPECTAPEKISPYFPYKALPTGLEGPEDLLEVAVGIIHYRPEVRCTTRYRLKWGPKDRPETLTLFGKTFKDRQGAVLFERAKALRTEFEPQGDSFLIAPPLGYCDAIQSVWQLGLEGRALPEAIDKASAAPLMEKLAKGLALFHQSRLRSPVRISPSGHLLEIRKKIAKLRRAFPQFEATLAGLEREIEQGALGLSPMPESLIHADFSVQQLLVCGERLACFDFDEFAMGDPMQDVANFVVDLHFRGYSSALVGEMILTFVKAYEEKAGLEIPKKGLTWYLQILFVTKAYRCYLQRRPQLEQTVQAILALAQEKALLKRSES